MTLLGNFVRTSGQGKELRVEWGKKVMRKCVMKTRRRNKMSLHAQPLEPIPELTSRIARASFPKGTLAMQLRDALGPIYEDADFADLFPKRGRAAEAPWRLALVSVLQALENLSDRQAAEMVRARLDWKYALSLPLDDEGFDASILPDFRQRLVDHEAQDRLLEPILQVCRQHGWLKAGGKQRTDSTWVIANVRGLSSLESVGESLRAALNEIAEVAPDWLLEIVSPDWFDRYVHRFELQRFPKGEQAKADLRRQVGEDSWHLLQAATNEHAPQSVQACPSLARLQQVWQQHFERVDDQVRWRDGPAVESAERVISPYEMDARASRKRETDWVGYKVHLTETCGEEDAVHLIVQAEISAATEQDVEETMPLLHDLQARDLLPEVRLVDSGYVSGEVLAKHAELDIELVGPLKQEGGWQHETGHGLSAFQVDWDKQQVRCPQGHLSQNWCPGRHNRGEEVIWVRFSTVTCQACPVKELCTKREKNKGRILTLSPQAVHEARSRRRAEQSSPAFQQRYALRAGIEGTISEGVRGHGLRRARYRGQPKTQLQAKAIAAAINLVRIRQMLQRMALGLPPQPKRSLSPFAQLRARLAA
jgi:transposase